MHQVKPAAGDPNLTTISIPGTPLCLRIWPGNHILRENCIDFAFADSIDEPIDPPPGFELYTDGPAGRRWLGVGRQEARTLQEIFNIPDKDQKAGDATYVVLDGMACLLEYGFSSLHFEIPVR